MLQTREIDLEIFNLDWPLRRCLLLGGAGLGPLCPYWAKSCLTAPRVGNDQLGVEDQSQSSPNRHLRRGMDRGQDRCFPEREGAQLILGGGHPSAAC